MQIVSIHTPEFDFEKARSQVIKVATRHKIDFPIMMDNDYAYWKALGNRYWPAWYLVDKNGNIVYKGAGELHQGDHEAVRLEKLIEQYLKG